MPTSRNGDVRLGVALSNSIILAYRQMGDYKEAVVYAETKVAKDILEAGPDHYLVKEGKLRLSKLWQKAGDAKLAEFWCDEAEGGGVEVLVQKASLMSLGGNHGSAIELERQVQKFLAMSFGAQHELVGESGERVKAYLRLKIEDDLKGEGRKAKAKAKKKRQKKKKTSGN